MILIFGVLRYCVAIVLCISTKCVVVVVQQKPLVVSARSPSFAPQEAFYFPLVRFFWRGEKLWSQDGRGAFFLPQASRSMNVNLLMSTLSFLLQPDGMILRRCSNSLKYTSLLGQLTRILVWLVFAYSGGDHNSLPHPSFGFPSFLPSSADTTF